MRAVDRQKASTGRGGARPGAGRPRTVQEPARIAVDFEKPDLEALRALAERRGTSIAELVRRAVSQYLRRAGRGVDGGQAAREGRRSMTSARTQEHRSARASSRARRSSARGMARAFGFELARSWSHRPTSRWAPTRFA
jgi:hypothetical protein